MRLGSLPYRRKRRCSSGERACWRGCLSVDRLSRWMGRGWCTYAHVNLVLLVGIHLGYQFFVSKTWWKQRKGVLGMRIV